MDEPESELHWPQEVLAGSSDGQIDVSGLTPEFPGWWFWKKEMVLAL